MGSLHVRGHTHSKDVDAAEDDSDDLSWASSSDFEDEVYVPEAMLHSIHRMLFRTYYFNHNNYSQ
eukprot:6480469-Amphidinium_carterae.1